MLGRDALQAVEALLRQQRAAIAQAAHVLEEPCPQISIAFQRLEQHRIGGRHGAEAGRRELAQVFERLLEAPGYRPTTVNIERARNADDAVEVGVATPGVMPGQPVERHGDALVVERFAHHADHFRRRGKIAVRVQNALGEACRP